MTESVDSSPTGVGASRPRRADVTVSYDLGVGRYDQLWSPVILPAAVALIPWLGLASGAVVLDVGGGTGALVPSLRSAAPSVSVFVLDASTEMLRVASRARSVPAIRADAMALPVADGSADAVLLAYVLFHLAEPLAALEEAWRVLRPGGRVATVTWASERPEKAQQIWDATLAEAQVPTLRVRRVDTGLDSAEAVEQLLVSAGLSPLRVWSHRLRQQWDRRSFWELVSGAGTSRQRLGLLEPAARSALLDRLQARLAPLGPEDYRWEGEVICAVAAKAAEDGR